MAVITLPVILHLVNVISTAVFSIKSKQLSLECLKDLGHGISMTQCSLKCRKLQMNPAMTEDSCFCELKQCVAHSQETNLPQFKYLSSFQALDPSFGYDEWSAFNECSECAGKQGVQHRTRVCKSEHIIRGCSGISRESRNCTVFTRCEDMFSIRIAKQTNQVPQVSKLHQPFQALSVCSWVKLTAGASNNLSHLFSFHTPQSDGVFAVMVRPGRVSVYSDSAYIVYTNATVSYEGVWSHLCASLSDSGTIIYLNRSQVYSTSSVKIASHTSIVEGTLTLGNDVDYGVVNDPLQCMVGEITQFFLFNKKLTQQEVDYAYHNNITSSMIGEVIVAWSDFKQVATGGDVYKTSYPFH